jgi:hypothetical protein
MPASPWKRFTTVDDDADVVAMISYLSIRSYRALPRVVKYSLQVQRQLNASPGLIGHSMQAQLFARHFWTLSAWVDAAALKAFVGHSPHIEIMKSLLPEMDASEFAQWRLKGRELPLLWKDAKRRLHKPPR